MAQIDEIIAEADQYTNYCRLVDYQAAKAEEYVTKAAQQALSNAGLVTAVFPIVGSTIVALRAQASQIIVAAEESVEAAASSVAVADKLDELTPPEEGC